jgi:hypothetical protein
MTLSDFRGAFVREDAAATFLLVSHDELQHPPSTTVNPMSDLVRAASIWINEKPTRSQREANEKACKPLPRGRLSVFGCLFVDLPESDSHHSAAEARSSNAVQYLGDAQRC